MRLPGVPWFVSLVVVFLLAGLLVWQGLVLADDRRVEERRDEAVEVAEAQVLDLTTLDSDSVGEKLKSLADRTSGDFADQLTGITQTFQNIVTERQLTTTGSIVSAAVTSSSATSAAILVASSALISENGQEAINRTYRMRVKLGWEKGTWKVTNMEFVG